MLVLQCSSFQGSFKQNKSLFYIMSHISVEPLTDALCFTKKILKLQCIVLRQSEMNKNIPEERVKFMNEK